MTKKVAANLKKDIRTKNLFIKGTRIPLTFFFDYILEGLTISDFLSSYPWVKKKNLIQRLEEVKEETASRYAV